MSLSFYTLPLFGRDDDLDDSEIPITTSISNQNPRKMRSKKDLDRRSALPWLQDPD
ncbi:unnamed protein product [Camellia sinensis]